MSQITPVLKTKLTQPLPSLLHSLENIKPILLSQEKQKINDAKIKELTQFYQSLSTQDLWDFFNSEWKIHHSELPLVLETLIQYLIPVAIRQNTEYQIITLAYFASLANDEEVIKEYLSASITTYLQARYWIETTYKFWESHPDADPVLKFKMILGLYNFLDDKFKDLDTQIWDLEVAEKLFLINPDTLPKSFWKYWGKSEAGEEVDEDETSKQIDIWGNSYHWEYQKPLDLPSQNSLTTPEERIERMKKLGLTYADKQLCLSWGKDDDNHVLPNHILGGLPELLVDNFLSVEDFPNSDLDFYLSGEEGATGYLKFLNSFDTVNDRDRLYLFEKKYVASLFIEDYPRKIQFIKSGYQNHFQILRHFDYSHAKWMMNSQTGEILGLPDALHALRTRKTEMKIVSNYTLPRWFKARSKKYQIVRSANDPFENMTPENITKYYLQSQMLKIPEFTPRKSKNKMDHLNNVNQLINTHNVRLFQLNTQLYLPSDMRLKDTKLYQDSGDQLDKDLMSDGLKNFRHYDETHPDGNKVSKINTSSKMDSINNISSILSFDDFSCYNHYISEDIKTYIDMSPTIRDTLFPNKEILEYNPNTLFPFQFNIPAGGVISLFEDREVYKKGLGIQKYCVCFESRVGNTQKLFSTIDLIQKKLYHAILGKEIPLSKNTSKKNKKGGQPLVFTPDNFKIKSVIPNFCCTEKYYYQDPYDELYDSNDSSKFNDSKKSKQIEFDKYAEEYAKNVGIKLFLDPIDLKLLDHKEGAWRKSYLPEQNSVLSEGNVTLAKGYIIQNDLNSRYYLSSCEKKNIYVLYPRFVVKNATLLKTANFLSLKDGEYDEFLNISNNKDKDPGSENNVLIDIDTEDEEDEYETKKISTGILKLSLSDDEDESESDDESESEEEVSIRKLKSNKKSRKVAKK